MNDYQLVTRILSGEKIFGVLVRRYVNTLGFFLIRTMRLPPEGKDDVLQTLFMQLYENDYRKLRLWRGPATLENYLKTMARNLAVDWLKKRGVVMGDLPNEDFPNAWQAWPAGNNVVTPEGQVVLDNLRTILTDSISRLSPRCQSTLTPRFFQDLDNQEIADDLNITLGNVAVTIHNCLKHLRQILAKTYRIHAFPVDVF